MMFFRASFLGKTIRAPRLDWTRRWQALRIVSIWSDDVFAPPILNSLFLLLTPGVNVLLSSGWYSTKRKTAAGPAAILRTSERTLSPASLQIT